MRPFLIGGHVVAMPSLSHRRRVGGYGGGGNNNNDDVGTFFLWLSIMLLVSMFCGGLYIWWDLATYKTESHRMEFVVESATPYKRSKYNKKYWIVSIQNKTDGLSHKVEFRRKDETPEFQIDKPFTTWMVIHTTRSGRSIFYFPSINEDIPKIEPPNNGN